MKEHLQNFFLLYRGKIFGPFSLPEIRQMYQAGRIDASAQISQDKLSWESLCAATALPSLQSIAVPEALRGADAPILPIEQSARKSAPYRVCGTVLQTLWNAPVAAEKMHRFPERLFWHWGFGGALIFSILLLTSAGAATAYFEGGMLRRILTNLTGELLWSMLLWGELCFLRGKNTPKNKRPAGELFTLCSTGACILITLLLLGGTMWRIAGMDGTGWRFYGACAFSCTAGLCALFGAVNQVCGIYGVLRRFFRLKPAPSLFFSAWLLTQEALLYLCCRLG